MLKNRLWEFNSIHARHVFSKSFPVNIFIFNHYNEEPDTQNGKGFWNKNFERGVKAENSPLTVTLAWRKEFS